MSSKIKLSGYKHELFVVDNRLATDFFYLVTDNQIKNEFIKFHETQRSGWADDTIIKDLKSTGQMGRLADFIIIRGNGRASKSVNQKHALSHFKAQPTMAKPQNQSRKYALRNH